jgi:hypothetical protein
MERAREILEKYSNRRFTPDAFRSYKCEYCGFFHLTGKV